MGTSPPPYKGGTFSLSVTPAYVLWPFKLPADRTTISANAPDITPQGGGRMMTHGLGGSFAVDSLTTVSHARHLDAVYTP